MLLKFGFNIRTQKRTIREGNALIVITKSMYTVDADKDFFYQIRWHVCRTISKLQYLNILLLLILIFLYKGWEKIHVSCIWQLCIQEPMYKTPTTQFNDCFLSYFTVVQLSLLDYNTIRSTVWDMSRGLSVLHVYHRTNQRRFPRRCYWIVRLKSRIYKFNLIHFCNKAYH